MKSLSYNINNTRIFILLFFIYAFTRVGVFYSLPWVVPTLTYDGVEYLKLSHYALLNPSLFLERPFLYPVFLKIFKQNIFLAQNIQLFLSICAWFYCAFSLSLLASNKKYRLLILSSVLIYSLSFYIILWDVLILTESLSISALISYVSCILLILQRELTLNRLFLLLLFSAVLVFLKDSAVYLIILISIPLAVYLIMRRCHLSIRSLTIACVLLIVTSAFIWESDSTNNEGKRWLIPLKHVSINRMPQSPEMLNYFNAHNVQEKNAVYKKFLMTHPRYVLSPLTKNEYWSSWWITPYLVKKYLNYGHAYTQGVFIALMINNFAYVVPFVLSAFLLFGVIKKNKYFFKDRIILAVLYGIFSTVILSLIVWHADTLGIPRHQLETYLFLILCLFMGVVRVFTTK